MENAVAAVPKLVDLLVGLNSEERKRAISAAMTLLGDSPVATSTAGASMPRGGREYAEAGDGISAKAVAWMTKSQITREQLEHVFSIDEKSIDVIAHKMPGDSKRKQTAEAYVIAGLMAYIQTGDLQFTDDAARDVCRKVACYDQANHANYMKAFANWIGGNKNSWKLSNPGLTKAAEIVKTIAPASNA
jgi:hypothetical protein